MDPLKQRIAIAKVCGWEQTVPDKDIWTHGDYINWRARDMPDYLNDLNAMHKAILQMYEKLGDSFWSAFRLQLEKLNESDFWNASAAQRAEAFLKTLNLWEE
jgi:hypothetical protein